jgi:hypothetical protein
VVLFVHEWRIVKKEGNNLQMDEEHRQYHEREIGMLLVSSATLLGSIEATWCRIAFG